MVHDGVANDGWEWPTLASSNSATPTVETVEATRVLSSDSGEQPGVLSGELTHDPWNYGPFVHFKENVVSWTPAQTATANAVLFPRWADLSWHEMKLFDAHSLVPMAFFPPGSVSITTWVRGPHIMTTKNSQPLPPLRLTINSNHDEFVSLARTWILRHCIAVPDGRGIAARFAVFALPQGLRQLKGRLQMSRCFAGSARLLSWPAIGMSSHGPGRTNSAPTPGGLGCWFSWGAQCFPSSSPYLQMSHSKRI